MDEQEDQHGTRNFIFINKMGKTSNKWSMGSIGEEDKSNKDG